MRRTTAPLKVAVSENSLKFFFAPHEKNVCISRVVKQRKLRAASRDSGYARGNLRREREQAATARAHTARGASVTRVSPPLHMLAVRRWPRGNAFCRVIARFPTA